MKFHVISIYMTLSNPFFFFQNPVQVVVAPFIDPGPWEDSTRIGRSGTARRQAVDVSPFRRVNQAIYLLTTRAR